MDSSIMFKAAVIGGLVFAVFKLLFGFLGWFSRDVKDKLYQDRLETVWLQLQEYSLADIVHIGLDRLVNRVRETFSSKRNALVWFVLFSLVINFFSCLIAWTIMGVYLDAGRTFKVILDVVKMFIFLLPLKLCFITIATTLLGSIFDLISILITWYFIKSAARVRSIIRTLRHLAIDSFIAVMASLWAFVCLMLWNILSEGIDFSDLLNIPKASFLIIVNKMAGGIFIIVTGISAAFPTIAYIFIGLVSLAAHFTPKPVHRFISRIIYLVTTDKKPVLSQLGTVFGALVGLMSAIAAALALA